VSAMKMPIPSSSLAILMHSIPFTCVVDFFHFAGGGLRDAGWNGEHLIHHNFLAILPGLPPITTCCFLASDLLPVLAPLPWKQVNGHKNRGS